MTSPPNPRPLPSYTRIAIIGGGIAGLCCTLGLLKHPHIDVHIYEAAPTFSEFGAGVEIGPNAQTALKLLSPLAEKAFTETTTPNLWRSHEKIFCDYIVVSGFGSVDPLCVISITLKADDNFILGRRPIRRQASLRPKMRNRHAVHAPRPLSFKTRRRHPQKCHPSQQTPRQNLGDRQQQ